MDRMSGLIKYHRVELLRRFVSTKSVGRDVLLNILHGNALGEIAMPIHSIDILSRRISALLTASQRIGKISTSAKSMVSLSLMLGYMMRKPDASQIDR